MKNGYSILTYYYDEKGEPKRIRDKINRYLWMKGLFEVRDCYTLVSNGQKCGGFYNIYGKKIIVDILDFFSNLTCKYNNVEIPVRWDGRFI